MGRARARGQSDVAALLLQVRCRYSSPSTSNNSLHMQTQMQTQARRKERRWVPDCVDNRVFHTHQQSGKEIERVRESERVPPLLCMPLLQVDSLLSARHSVPMANCSPASRAGAFAHDSTTRPKRANHANQHLSRLRAACNPTPRVVRIVRSSRHWAWQGFALKKQHMWKKCGAGLIILYRCMWLLREPIHGWKGRARTTGRIPTTWNASGIGNVVEPKVFAPSEAEGSRPKNPPISSASFTP
jgi:hypothetical protein